MHLVKYYFGSGTVVSLLRMELKVIDQEYTQEIVNIVTAPKLKP